MMRKSDSNRSAIRYALLLLLTFAFRPFQSEAVNVKDFGAIGDGIHIDTPAINAAIEHVWSNGGGKVTFPEGTYLSYSIHLKSDVTLFMGKGAHQAETCRIGVYLAG